MKKFNEVIKRLLEARQLTYDEIYDKLYDKLQSMNYSNSEIAKIHRKMNYVLDTPSTLLNFWGGNDEKTIAHAFVAVYDIDPNGSERYELVDLIRNVINLNLTKRKFNKTLDVVISKYDEFYEYYF